MHKSFILLLAATLVTITSADELPPTARIVLSDGSSLNGTPVYEVLEGDTCFAKDIKLPIAAIGSIAFKESDADGKVSLTNGDSFAFKALTKVFAVKTVIGELAIPTEAIKNIIFQGVAPASSDGLLCHITFEGPESIKGKVNNAEFVKGKVGRALRVQRGLSACEIQLPSGTLGPKGCIEFWASMIDGKTEFTTGGDPRFFTLHGSNGTEFGAMEYASNNGQANSGLWGTLPSGHAYSNRGFSQMMSYSDIFHGKPYEGWHHYAIVWNYGGIHSEETNGRSVAIFVDGHVITSYEKTNSSKESLKNFGLITNLAIPMRLSGPSFNNKSNFLIDELKIWNFDKTEFAD